MSAAYSPSAVSTFYDKYGSRERERLRKTAYARLIGHLHAQFLREVVHPGHLVGAQSW